MIEGNTLGALVSAGSVGLDVMPFIKIGKLPGSKADALGLANKSKRTAEVPKGGRSNTQPKTYTKQSGKNEKHSNPDRRSAAKREYEKTREEYKKLDSKPNKIPKDKDLLDKLEKRLKHLEKKAKESGETHSRRTKKR